MHGRHPLTHLAANAVAVAAVAVIVAAYVGRAFDFRRLPDYGEGTVLAAVERLRQAGPSPEWIAGPPYTFCPYGPIYYWATAGATALLGWEHTLVPGRLVSLAATLAAAALIVIAVRRAAGSLVMGLLASAMYLTTSIAHHWAAAHRVDALATLLALAAYVSAALGGWALAASALCVAAGSLVKQTVALSAVPIFLWLVVQKRYKAALGYAALVTVLGVAGWLLVDRSSGGYYLACSVKGHLGKMSLVYGFWKGYDSLFTLPGMVATVLVVWLAVARPWMLARSLWVLAFIVSTATATLLASRRGSATCYFLEASALAAIAIGAIGLRRLVRRNACRAAVAAALVTVAVAMPDLYLLCREGIHLEAVPYASPLVEDRLQGHRGDWALADGYHLDAALRAGLVPALNDSFFLRMSVEAGRQSPQPLVEAMEDGRIRWLILRLSAEEHVEQIGTISQKWPAAVAQAMQRLYVLEASGDDVYLYRRSRTAPERRP